MLWTHLFLHHTGFIPHQPDILPATNYVVKLHCQTHLPLFPLFLFTLKCELEFKWLELQLGTNLAQPQTRACRQNFVKIEPRFGLYDSYRKWCMLRAREKSTVWLQGQLWMNRLKSAPAWCITHSSIYSNLQMTLRAWVSTWQLKD